MDGEEVKKGSGGTVDPAALAKAALAAVMSKPNGAAAPAAAPTLDSLQAELAALKAQSSAAPVKAESAKVDKQAAKAAKKEAKLKAKADAKAAKAAKKAAKAAAPAAPMTEAEAKALVASYEGKRGRRPAAYHEALKLVGAPVSDGAPPPAKKAKPAKKQKKAKKGAEASSSKPMTVSEAKAFVASFEGKRGRRPAEYHEALKIAGIAAATSAAKSTKPKKAPKAKKVKTQEEAKPMSLKEAKAYVASFEGKRGRRPADYHAAVKICGAAE